MNSPSKRVIKRDIKTSMAMLLRSDKNLNIKNQITSNEYVLRETADKVCKELQVLGWRFKTSLPIIKPLSFKILQFQQFQQSFRKIKQSSFQLNNGCRHNYDQISSIILIQKIEQSPNLHYFDLQIVIEEIKYRLSQLDLLPFNQIIYLLKEMMIGYDVLLDIFGTFDPIDQMIALNQHFQWRLWINQNYYLNKKSAAQNQISEKEFIYKLIFIAENHCHATNLSRQFFQEIKQFTYNKQCNFIKILQKIKDFIFINKIFQVNRVTLINERRQKLNVFNSTEDPLTNPPKLMKKLSYNTSSNININNKTSMLNFSRSSTNLIQNQSKYTPPMYNNVSNNPFKSGLEKSVTFVGNGGGNLTPKNNYSRIISPAVQLNKQSTLKFNSLKLINHNNYQNNYLNNFPKISANPEKIPAEQKFIEYNKKFSKIFEEKGKISQFLQQAATYQTKGRHHLKAIINSHNHRANNSFLSPQPVQKQRKKSQKKKKDRKYSEQLVNYKSGELMYKKKFSNIFQNDHETHGLIDVIKTKPAHKQNTKYQPQQQYCNKFDTSPSSMEIQKSKESSQYNKNKNYNQQYQTLKMNDSDHRFKNNQSSLYQHEQNNHESESKQMTVSFNHQNKQQNNEQKSNGSGWAKKISGLFSDDASIKQLKQSVKFKTQEQRLFEKQYLKDVKLDLLQKFGRPVRHSIADEDDNYLSSPYKSMQLIEEALDQGKSYVEKEEECEQQPQVFMRKRNQTVQVQKTIPTKNEQKDEGFTLKPFQTKSIDCNSVEEDEENNNQGFNFEPQPYTLFKIK